MFSHKLLLILSLSMLSCMVMAYVCQAGDYEDPAFTTTSLATITSNDIDFEVKCACSDQNGGTIIGIRAQGVVTAGSFVVGSANPNEDSILIVKMNSTNSVQWVRRFGSSKVSTVRSVQTDKQGHVYFAGSILATTSFDSFNISTALNLQVAILVKLNGTSGEVIWATVPAENPVVPLPTDYTITHDMKMFPIPGTSEEAVAVIIFTGGNCRIGTTNYSYTAASLLLGIFNSTTGVVVSHFPIGTINDGNYFAKLAIAMINSQPYFLASSTFANPATFFSTDNKTATLSSSGLFYAFYHYNGTLIWVNRSSGTRIAQVLFAPIQNSIFISGIFTGSLNYAGTLAISNSDGADIFLMQLDLQGTLIWAKKYGSPTDDVSYGLAMNEDGSGIFLSGLLKGFGTIGTLPFTYPGGESQFLAHIGLDGNGKYAISPVDSLDMNIADIFANGKDSVTYVGASKQSKVISWPNFNFTATATKTIFVAQNTLSCKPCPFGKFSNTVNAQACTSCQPNTYNDKVKQTFCAQCPLFMTSLPGATSVNDCSSCGLGSYIDAKSGGGKVYGVSTSAEVLTGMTQDAAKNKYITGTFTSSITFGSITLLANGSTDVFLVKMDVNNNVIFAVRAGGTSNEFSTGVAVDTSGNSYISGYFTGTMIFDKNTCMVISAGGTDIFVAKFNSTGNVVWCRRAGRNTADSDDRANSITYDPTQDAIFVAGQMRGGPGNTFPPLSINGAGFHDAFIARYNTSTGNCEAVKRAGGSAASTSYATAITSFNSTICIVGTSEAVTMTVDTLTFPLGGGLAKIFLACFNSSLSVAWASFGGNPNDYNYGNGIALDLLGNVYITGSFLTTCTFQTITIPTSGGASDAVIAKFNPSGVIQWVKALGGTGDLDTGVALFSDGTQYLFVTGLVSGNAQFGTFATSGSNAQADLFVVQLKSSNADVIWVSRSSGSGYTVEAKFVTTDYLSDIVVGGSLQKTMVLGGTSLSSNGTTFSDALYATVKLLCAKCPSGRYYDSNVTIFDVNACKTCPGGTYGTVAGSTSTQDCLSCIAGSYSLPGQGACTLCPRGTFSALPSASQQSSCQSCSAGTYSSSNGSISCSYCFAGTFSTGGAQVCSLCPAGTYSVESNAPSIVSCQACPSGSYSPFAGSTVCQLCSPGTFNDQSNRTSCNLCPQGTFAPNFGSNSESSCLKCPIGTYSSVFGATSNASCISCPQGTYSTVQGAKSNTMCTACDAGKFNANFGSSNESACELCANGTFASSFGSIKCVECNGGYVSGRGKSSCDICGAGTTSNSARTECIPCLRGQYSPNPGSLICLNCPRGSYTSTNGSTSCSLCPKGTYGIIEGATSIQDCIPCAAGYYSTAEGSASASNCIACPEGSYSNVAGANVASTCLPCIAGTYSAVRAANHSSFCIPCDQGYFSSVSGSFTSATCLPCPAGSYSTMKGASLSSSCVLCPYGTYSTTIAASSNASCIPCQGGYASNVIGASSPIVCNECSKGYYSESSIASKTCKACEPGTFSATSAANSSETCLSCPVGTFSASYGAISVLACQKCVPGYYSNHTGATTCLPCDAGFYSNLAGSTKCLPCEQGKFASSAGSSVCSDCTPGTYNDQLNATSCKFCVAGSFSTQNGGKSIASCNSCPPGAFSSLPGSTLCSSCPVNQYANESKSTSCSICSAGTYTDAAGSASCKSCARGSYLDIGLDGLPKCSFCPNGYVGVVSTISSVSTSCAQCKAGTIPHPNKLDCVSCEPGFFAANPGSSVCSPCSPGYSSQAPFSSCFACAAGKYENATKCLSCPSGTFSSAAGSASCSKCRAGSFSQGDATSCTVCPTGFYSSNDQAERCEPCGLGTYANTTANTICLPCPNPKLCFIATKNPPVEDVSAPNPIFNLGTSNDTQVSAASSSNYFADQQELLRLKNSDVSRLAIIISCAILLLLISVSACVWFVIMCKCKQACCTKSHALLKAMDFFSLKHYTLPEHAVYNHFTVYGGFWTILLVVLVVVIIVLSIMDIVKVDNKIETATVVPKETLKDASVNGVFNMSVFFHGFTDECKPNSIAITSIVANGKPYVQSLTAFPNNTCKFEITCENCTLQGITQSVELRFTGNFVSASAMEVIVTLPYFAISIPYVTVRDRVLPSNGNSSFMFRGASTTQVSLSLTTTQYTSINALDYFLYSALSKIFLITNEQQKTGYSAVKNPAIPGTNSEFSNFWNQTPELNLLIRFDQNANAYLIYQQGRDTILDFFGKISALIAAAISVLAVIMSQSEKWYNRARAKLAPKKDTTSDNVLELEPSL